MALAPENVRRTRRKSAGRTDEDPAQLAVQIMAVCREVDGEPVEALPGERSLARQLGVTRYAVRNALAYLEDKGLIRRWAGRGTVAARPSQVSRGSDLANLKCINIVISPMFESADMHWLLQSYLTGYTEVLDLYDVKTRFIVWEDHGTDYASVLWAQADHDQQACLLINRRIGGLLGWLNEQKVPYVVQNHAVYDDHLLPPHHKVYVNKAGGCFEATRHLLELGHRRIGFIGPTPAPHRMAAECDGYVAAIQCAGLTIRPDDVFDFVTQVAETAVEPARRFLDRRDRPTAVVTGSGAIAMGVLEAADGLGVSVPDELSVVGLSSDGTDRDSRLSTITVPRRELARSAMQLLLDNVAQPPSEMRTVVIECKLDWRQTTGPRTPDKTTS